MRIAIAIAVVAGAAGIVALQDRDVAPVDRTRFLFAAVIEGLARDGFDPKLAGAIAENPKKWFIPSCPVCEPVLLAFHGYKASCENWRMKSEPWSGSRLPKTTLEALRSADTATRHKALEGLISAYVEERFTRTRMSEEAKDKLRESLKIGMKEGLEQLKAQDLEDAFPASCPSCEGAN